jgi:Domain of unknown function (DUF3943)/Outer membrane protein beta-barrel domain
MSVCAEQEKNIEVERSPFMLTNSAWEYNESKPIEFENPYTVSLFNAQHGENSDRLWSQTKSIFGYGLGVVGFIYMLPEDVSNWDKEGEVFRKWGDNVTSGPVWDRDAPWINYIGHPYFGGVYYQAARKSGYRQWDSFLYSLTMSTFYWEYGVEAFAEVPAIQDLVVTPVLGWAVGEWAFQTEQQIRKEGSQVWGSDFWGKTALFFLDPVDSLGDSINRLFGKQIVHAGTGYMGPKTVLTPDGDIETRFEFSVNYQLGSGKTYTPVPYTQDYFSQTNDPVDTSIIGLGFGTGYTQLDPSWGVQNGPFLEASLGLYFSKAWSARLSYARAHLEDNVTGENLAYENYSVNGQYYFNQDNNLRPYFMIGFGEEMRDQDRDRKTFTSSFGAGLHYKITNKLAIQSELKRFISTRYDTIDDTFSINLVYRLNKGEWL